MTDKEKAKQLYCKYRETDFARESAAFNAAMEMAKWKEEQMIEKACEWLKNNMHKYLVAKADGADYRITIFDDFKKAMEE